MQSPFDEEFKEIADSMGIALYQRFSLNEASLFLRCPENDLQDLVKKKTIQYIQVSKTEIQFFGYQLLQHLLDSVAGHSSYSGSSEKSSDTQDRILRVQEVQQVVGLSRSTIWRLEGKGKFPTRVPLGASSIGWLKSDIETWINSKKS